MRARHEKIVPQVEVSITCQLAYDKFGHAREREFSQQCPSPDQVTGACGIDNDRFSVLRHL
jgi:hypothetical protein